MNAVHMTVASALLLSVLAGPGHAEEPKPLTSEQWIKTRAQNYVREGQAVETAKSALEQFFKSTDVDGGGYSARDDVLKRQKSLANQRSAHIQKWAAQDLNGDGEVSLAELQDFFSQAARNNLRASGAVVAPTPEQVEQILKQNTQKALAFDINGDRIVTFHEVLEAADELLKKNSASRQTQAAIPPSLDLNADGTVTLAEFNKSVAATLSAIDTDGDGTFSKHERATLSNELKALKKQERAWRAKRKEDEKLRKLAEKCRFPAAPSEAKLVLLSAVKGRALSSVTLGRLRKPVTVSDIYVEPGSQPLYVLLAGRSRIIWRFTGAVERVLQVVVNGSDRGAEQLPLAGVTGLAAERIHFVPTVDCLRPFRKQTPSTVSETNDMVGRILGRTADAAMSQNSISTVSVPTGVFETNAVYANTRDLPRDGAGSVIWEEFLSSFPGGVIEIDPNSVVTSGEAHAADLLPGMAGLAQLVDKGTLKVIGYSNIVTLGNTTIVLGQGDKAVTPDNKNILVRQVPDSFLILRETALPTGLYGGTRVRFTLKSGVPLPDPIAEYHCIYDQATGEKINGNKSCR